jgi:Oxidoreductase family, NAD-binding Rossmann fold
MMPYRSEDNDAYDNPQSAAMTIRYYDQDDINGPKLTANQIARVVRSCMTPDVKALMDHKRQRIAIVVADVATCQDPSALSSIRSPVSTCVVDSLVILDKPDNEPVMRTWLEDHAIELESSDMFFGEDGFQAILNRSVVDAVFIFVPASQQLKYSLAVLEAKKHVLIKDPVSTPFHEFSQQINCAWKVQKFLQFKAMFANHYRSKSFWDCICAAKTFGNIRRIEAILYVNVKDLSRINIPFPITAGHGCIRRLARFCMLIATLIVTDEQPVRATVVKHDTDPDSGEPLSATCLIEFERSVTVQCKVGYMETQKTRQVLTIHSDSNRSAEMTDFVIPHPDGLANYRVYDKDPETGWLVSGECLDDMTGPPQDVTLWREFHRICQNVDAMGWAKAREAQRLTRTALATKHVLLALDQSFREKGTTVDVKIESESPCGE